MFFLSSFVGCRDFFSSFLHIYNFRFTVGLICFYRELHVKKKKKKRKAEHVFSSADMETSLWPPEKQGLRISASIFSSLTCSGQRGLILSFQVNSISAPSVHYFLSTRSIMRQPEVKSTRQIIKSGHQTHSHFKQSAPTHSEDK